MANLSVKYLGLELSNPVIISSSPLTASAEKVAILAEHGAGTVVLKSIFEEQIMGETAMLERYSDYPEAADYLHAYVGSDYIAGYLDMIRECKQRVKIPVIASINCSTSDAWIDYARRIHEAGADALELNIFLLPTDADTDAGQIESRYLEIVGQVVAAVPIPVSVKLGTRFTNILNVARQIYFRRGRGVVMYNRFFEPDIDISSMTLTSADSLSSPAELRNALRTTALCSAAQPELDVAVSTGIHSGEDAVKAILAGASAVQVCSTVYQNGLGMINRINDFVANWMDKNSFEHVGDFRGKLDYKGVADAEVYQRVQFMRYFPK
ncbi:MAG: dihydroorotate dehydrogenase-like protein [Rikenellaceae bacterium]|jgi:dihydroorotate dehydrogenase (fumarate)|nr:dihydroorotate dehydrogenase-like protein [Rikenellaceae bacterium]